MKILKLLILSFMILSGNYAFSQETYLGVRLGFSPNEIVNSDKENLDYFIGIKADIKPDKPIVAFSFEVQYFTKSQVIAIPIGPYFRIGKKVSARLGGGMLILKDLRSVESEDDISTVGYYLSAGIEIPTSARLSVLAESGLYSYKVTSNFRSPGGAPYGISSANRNLCFSLGVLYRLQKD